MTGRKINPDVRALRGHACRYDDAPKTVAEQLDAATTGAEFGAVLSGFMNALADYTNCSGACADLGDDE